MSIFAVLLASAVGQIVNPVASDSRHSGVVAVYGPPVPTPPKKPTRTAPADTNCASARRQAGAQDIIVCAPTGFRFDPDVLAAEKAMHSAGRPVNPHESFKDHSCATIGPMGCRGVPTIDLVRVAAVVSTMAARASRGENVGTMFITDPQPTEYGLYKEAKAKREAAELKATARASAEAGDPPPNQSPDNGASTSDAVPSR